MPRIISDSGLGIELEKIPENHNFGKGGLTDSDPSESNLDLAYFQLKLLADAFVLEMPRKVISTSKIEKMVLYADYDHELKGNSVRYGIAQLDYTKPFSDVSNLKDETKAEKEYLRLEFINDIVNSQISGSTPWQVPNKTMAKNISSQLFSNFENILEFTNYDLKKVTKVGLEMYTKDKLGNHCRIRLEKDRLLDEKNPRGYTVYTTRDF